MDNGVHILTIGHIKGVHMRFFRNAVVILLFSSATAMAAPASESTIKQLLTVTEAAKFVDGMRARVDTMMTNSIQQALNGKTPNAAQQKAIGNMKSRMTTLVQGTLTWEKLEPMYLRFYKETFSEEEVSGILAFYKTPSGQAMIQKMPVLMQKTMVEFQKQTSGMAPQMQKIQQDFVAEMAAASK
ncbi:MAG: DUF2059 domain-containing protein [Sulfurimicrobium sp.]|jgi:hypothetical protein|nr:DUF2059 domain-containing protein [Sulfurimicrobium sp.]MDP2198835.1 DUF2059 domain-containing protein [Sulfurimicrobium sp.]MDP3687287.1 DUF2059 domain-containing protein [Sulfurimicrobium sp.]MDZ7656372.1 DUF2059 domain-containing protein [Sulfurimicrobium sp.]